VNTRASALAPAVVAYGLPGRALPLPETPLDDASWQALLRDVTNQRMTGLLAHAVHDGAFASTEPQAHELTEAHDRALARDLALERHMLRALAVLDDASLDARVLKGPALAHSAYPEPGMRSFGDIDLLVRDRDYDRVLGALRARGAHRRYPEPHANFDRRFGKGSCLVTDDGLELDVHRTFVAGPFGVAIATDELFTPGVEVVVGGRTVCGLDRSLQFLNACFHAVLGSASPRLVPLRDVAQLLLGCDVDPARVVDCCARWRCGVVVQEALVSTWSVLGLEAATPLDRWAATHRPDRFEQRSLQAYVGPARSYATQAVAGLAAVRGPRAKASYVRALLAADRDYVRDRDGTYRKRVRRAVALWRDSRRPPRAADGDR
jgi:hypothetical protein